MHSRTSTPISPGHDLHCARALRGRRYQGLAAASVTTGLLGAVPVLRATGLHLALVCGAALVCAVFGFLRLLPARSGAAARPACAPWPCTAGNEPPAHEEQQERSRKLANKLHRALLDGHLQLQYQPIFNAREQMVAVEALARWHDAEEGNIPPAEFVIAAEQCGLIVPFSNWVLRQACGQMAAWNSGDESLERIAVNVSVQHVVRSDFALTVLRVLAETGLPPAQLELEITESAMAEDFEPVRRNLRALRRLGVRVSIDDFGTGYSSLSRVRDLDADVLKIDRSFTAAADISANGAVVAKTIIEMAHHLQLSVIAEGIETEAQLARMRSLACDEVQGFLLGRPETADAISARLRSVRHLSRLPELGPAPVAHPA